MEDFYELLEVPRDASTEEINRAWRRKVRRYHPDVNDDARATAQFKTLKKAHEVLSEETERAAYDRMGHVKYVDERLDGLPTGPSRPGPTDQTSTHATASDTQRGSDDQRSQGTQSGTNRTTGTQRRGTSTSQRFGRKRQRNQGSTADRSRSNRTATSGTTSTTTGTGTEAGSRTQTGNAGHSEANATARSTNTRTRKRRATPLLYGWIAVVFAGALYLAGLWQYLTANATTLATVPRAALSDPMTALVGTFDLVGPTGFAFAATIDAPRTLLFPIGVVALAITLTAVVITFGRGIAYLYALGGITPVLALAADTSVALPDGVLLVLVGICPLVATAGFIVDVGRVAIGGRSTRS